MESQPRFSLARKACPFNCCSKTAPGDVAVVHRTAGGGREDRIVWVAMRRVERVFVQEGGERRHQYDASKRLWRLRLRVVTAPVELPPHVNDAALEIDVCPLKPEQFALTEAREDRRREQWPV